VNESGGKRGLRRPILFALSCAISALSAVGTLTCLRVCRPEQNPRFDYAPVDIAPHPSGQACRLGQDYGRYENLGDVVRPFPDTESVADSRAETPAVLYTKEQWWTPELTRQMTCAFANLATELNSNPESLEDAIATVQCRIRYWIYSIEKEDNVGGLNTVDGIVISGDGKSVDTNTVFHEFNHSLFASGMPLTQYTRGNVVFVEGLATLAEQIGVGSEHIDASQDPSHSHPYNVYYFLTAILGKDFIRNCIEVPWYYQQVNTASPESPLPSATVLAQLEEFCEEWELPEDTVYDLYLYVYAADYGAYYYRDRADFFPDFNADAVDRFVLLKDILEQNNVDFDAFLSCASWDTQMEENIRNYYQAAI